MNTKKILGLFLIVISLLGGITSVVWILTLGIIELIGMLDGTIDITKGSIFKTVMVLIFREIIAVILMAIPLIIGFNLIRNQKLNKHESF